MRVFLTCDDGIFETVGEEVAFPKYDDKFAVCQSMRNMLWQGQFSVTHCDTGFGVAFGDTIDEAITKAGELLAKKTEEEFKKAIARANEIRASITN